jgi:hypothetical protein
VCPTAFRSSADDNVNGSMYFTQRRCAEYILPKVKVLQIFVCVPAVKLPYMYIAITRSIARRHTSQNRLCRVNIMQSTSGR